jgi:hypothetical protein
MRIRSSMYGRLPMLLAHAKEQPCGARLPAEERSTRFLAAAGVATALLTAMDAEEDEDDLGFLMLEDAEGPPPIFLLGVA